MQAPTGEVTALLRRMKDGDKDVPEKLVPLVIDELRRLARHYMRNERVGHTLQPTALINEAYMRLAGYTEMDWQSRAHFIGVAASVMRQVLIDYARKKHAAKRGGSERDVELEENLAGISNEQSTELLDLDRALDKLAEMNARQAKIVEMRYFGGLTVEETAEALGVSPITVKRDWAVARAWLSSQIRGEDA
jgi:RNA polymerase sigma factor (TIGR02999 family)